MEKIGRSLVGSHSDHAEDQKKLNKLLGKWVNQLEEKEEENDQEKRIFYSLVVIITLFTSFSYNKR